MTCRGGWLEVPDVPGAAEVIAAQEALIRYSRGEYLPNRERIGSPMSLVLLRSLLPKRLVSGIAGMNIYLTG